ncbi:hypothetical protein COR42_01065 [Xanthomonas citri pv. citri]|nr:hypothetical protein COR42_01065 [Xanthomonas citri pv. citri]
MGWEWGMGNGEWGMGKREAGSGKREAGSGKREAGSGKREAGSGKRKSILPPGVRCNWAVVPASDSIRWRRRCVARPWPVATAAASTISGVQEPIRSQTASIQPQRAARSGIRCCDLRGTPADQRIGTSPAPKAVSMRTSSHFGPTLTSGKSPTAT